MEMQATARPLAELEAVIERGLGTFVEVGQALLEIRDARLYRESHGTFQDYCEQRWGFSRFRAYRLMEAASVVSVLPTGNIPTTERQARELTRLPEPEAVREVWAEVKEEKGDAVTAADVRQAVDRRLGIERPQATPVPTPVVAPVEIAPEPLGYDKPIEDSQGVPRITFPMAMPAPVREPEPGSLPSTQAIRDAHLASEFLHALRFATQIAAYSPDRVVAVLRSTDADATERSLSRLAAWLDQYRQARSAPLRIVGS